MDLGLKNRIALVAGASDGLGYATALALAAEGCKVAICSRSKERIEAAAARMIQEGGLDTEQVFPLVCDVTSEDAIMKVMYEVTEHWGGINILITNAGGPPSGYIDNFSADQWREALELNLISTINLCRHGLPLLKKAAAETEPLSRVLMITSVSARQPIPNLYLSNTSRAGVQGFAKSLSLELGPLGITVNTIMPGYTKTARLNDLSRAIQEQTGKTEEEIEKGWAEDNALKRLGEPSEFAAVATFLVSQPAGYITGVGMVVDGGRVKHLL